MRVLFASPECSPLVKVGGLGEVSSALPAALRRAGIDVRVLLPGYPGVIEAVPNGRTLAHLRLFDPPLQVDLIEAALPDGVPLMVIDCPRLYSRGGGPYQDEAAQDWPDNPLRFGLLSRVTAVLGGASSPLAWHPQIVHCNDWPTALAPAYLHFAPGARARTVMTIHNLAFQGNFSPDHVAALGLPPASFGVAGLEFHGSMSFLKAGLVYADALSTVSPNYAREIQSDSLGFGMEGLLRARRDSLYGILNGIDTRVWDPRTDVFVASRYGSETLEAKRQNKEALQRRLGLEIAADIPLLGAVSRLTHQKGIDLLVEAAPRLAAFPAQLAVLGAGERELERSLRSVAERYPGAISVVTAFDERLAHSIEAGADLFLMPSRFEPCGLNQMYSQRYGTPPIAHGTGGLVDTIVDCNPATLADASATGFLFNEPTVPALISAVERALAVFAQPNRWRALQRAGMARDFGWDAPAREYAKLYARLSPSD